MKVCITWISYVVWELFHTVFLKMFATLHAGFCSWSDWGGDGDEQLSNFLTYSCEVLGFIYDIFTHPALTTEVQETPRCTALYRLTLLAASPVMRHLNQSGQGGWLTFGSINCFVIWKLLSPWSRRSARRMLFFFSPFFKNCVLSENTFHARLRWYFSFRS